MPISNLTTIQTLIKTRLQRISNDVKTAFEQGNHIPLPASAQFVQDAVIQVHLGPPNATLASQTPLTSITAATTATVPS